MISLVEDIDQHWPQASKELERAFSQCEGESNHLDNLKLGLEQLWDIDGKAWAITRILKGKRGLIFEYVALAGSDVESWLTEFLHTSEAWARSQGCVCAAFTGRNGWRKRVPEYRQIRITMMKEL